MELLMRSIPVQRQSGRLIALVAASPALVVVTIFTSRLLGAASVTL